MRNRAGADRGGHHREAGRRGSAGGRAATGGLRPPRRKQKQKHSGVRRTGKPIHPHRPARSVAGLRGTSGAAAAPAKVAKFACPDCGKKFPSEAGMQTHQYNVHGSAPMAVGDLVRCTECGVLVRPKRLSEHRERMHGLR